MSVAGGKTWELSSHIEDPCCLSTAPAWWLRNSGERSSITSNPKDPQGTLQWKGEWTCMTSRGCFGLQNSQAFEGSGYLGNKQSCYFFRFGTDFDVPIFHMFGTLSLIQDFPRVPVIELAWFSYPIDPRQIHFRNPNTTWNLLVSFIHIHTIRYRTFVEIDENYKLFFSRKGVFGIPHCGTSSTTHPSHAFCSGAYPFGDQKGVVVLDRGVNKVEDVDSEVSRAINKSY